MWAWGRACWCGSLRQSGASVRVSAFRHPQRYPQFHWLAMDATGLSRTQIPCCYGLLSESVDFRGPGWMSMSIIDHQDHAASLRSAPVSLRDTNHPAKASQIGEEEWREREGTYVE